MQVTVQETTASAWLSVKGDEWSEATTAVSFFRVDTFGTLIPLPGGLSIQALGGSAVYQDLEMPIGRDLEYAALNEHGQQLTATANSANVHWGLWLKSRKAPELTTRLEWEEVGDLTSETRGTIYEVFGGGGIGQFGGNNSEFFTITGWVDGRIAYNRLRQLLAADRQIYMHTGEPKEIEDGWVQVTTASFPNPERRVIEMSSGMRYVTLSCTRIQAPVGAAKGGLGAPYRLVYTGYDDYQALYDSGATYGDLLEVS